MHRLTIVPLVGAFVLVLAACSTAPAPVASAPPAAAPPSTATSTPSSSPTTDPEEVDSDAVERCTTADLTAELGDADGEGQREVRVRWTNTSAATCTMTGFGGVDLAASDDVAGNYSLPRAQREAASVRLAPGERAHSTITFVSSDDASAYRPVRILVTPPDETRSFVLPWALGGVADQRAATRPGTYLGPVEAGA